MSQKKVVPRIPKGFLEFLPQEQLVINRLLETIRSSYESYGFTPLETPALELAEVILAKGGGETEKQVFQFSKGDEEYCLHFDLTVPLARYVAQHWSELVFPFKRYQIQKVWRAESPQKGRYREFYQCDVDIIGATSMTADAEIASVAYTTFQRLGFGPVTISINNRKLVTGLLESLEVSLEMVTDVLRIIDKADKIGQDNVASELKHLGLADSQVKALMEFTQISGSNDQVLQTLQSQSPNGNQIYEQGFHELSEVYKLSRSTGIPEDSLRINPQIARGLDYYTGTVYETTLDSFPQIGSVCSGGRFDDLTRHYSDRDLPGVGISIGLTRLFAALTETGVLDFSRRTPAKVLLVAQDDKYLPVCLEVADELRQIGVNTEQYLESHKMSKKLSYASRLGIPFVIIIGEEEVRAEVVALKDMRTGEQSKVRIVDLREHLL